MKYLLITCIFLAQYKARTQELRRCMVSLADSYKNELVVVIENKGTKSRTMIVDSTFYKKLTFHTAAFNTNGELLSTTYLEFTLNQLASATLVTNDTLAYIQFISQPAEAGNWPYLIETTNISNAVSSAAWEDTVMVGPWPITFKPKLVQWLMDFGYCRSLYPKIISDTLLASGTEFTIPFNEVSAYIWENDDYLLQQIDTMGGIVKLSKNGLITISSNGEIAKFKAKAFFGGSALSVTYLVDDENETHVTVLREGDFLFISNSEGQRIYTLNHQAITIK